MWLCVVAALLAVGELAEETAKQHDVIILGAEETAEQLDVIILGAGAAGIGAAAVLHAAGVTKFAVLEATNRTGGRVRAFEFGAAPHKVQVEAGANWISGAPGTAKGINPLWKVPSLSLSLSLSLCLP